MVVADLTAPIGSVSTCTAIQASTGRILLGLYMYKQNLLRVDTLAHRIWARSQGSRV